MRETEFLTACLDQDEEWARAARGWQTGSRHEGQPLDWSIHMRRWSPDNVLADIAAKRAILQAWIHADADAGPYPGTDAGRESGLYEAVLLLIQPYTDRPGFDPSWKV